MPKFPGRRAKEEFVMQENVVFKFFYYLRGRFQLRGAQNVRSRTKAEIIPKNLIRVMPA